MRYYGENQNLITSENTYHSQQTHSLNNIHGMALFHSDVGYCQTTRAKQIPYMHKVDSITN